LSQKLKLEFTPHKLLEKPTVNLGLVSGGSAPNTVAGDASATFDIRTLPGHTAEGIKSAFDKIIKEALPGDCKFKTSILGQKERTKNN